MICIGKRARPINCNNFRTGVLQSVLFGAYDVAVSHRLQPDVAKKVVFLY